MHLTIFLEAPAFNFQANAISFEADGFFCKKPPLQYAAAAMRRQRFQPRRYDNAKGAGRFGKTPDGAFRLPA